MPEFNKHKKIDLSKETARSNITMGGSIPDLTQKLEQSIARDKQDKLNKCNTEQAIKQVEDQIKHIFFKVQKGDITVETGKKDVDNFLASIISSNETDRQTALEAINRLLFKLNDKLNYGQASSELMAFLITKQKQLPDKSRKNNQTVGMPQVIKSNHMDGDAKIKEYDSQAYALSAGLLFQGEDYEQDSENAILDNNIKNTREAINNILEKYGKDYVINILSLTRSKILNAISDRKSLRFKTINNFIDAEISRISKLDKFS